AREPDLLRPGRSTYRITEPLVTFYQAVMRPAWTPLEQRRGPEVWQRSRQRFASAVTGPRFEDLVRDWASRVASPDTPARIPPHPRRHPRRVAESRPALPPPPLAIRTGPAGPRRGARPGAGDRRSQVGPATRHGPAPPPGTRPGSARPPLRPGRQPRPPAAGQ